MVKIHFPRPQVMLLIKDRFSSALEKQKQKWYTQIESQLFEKLKNEEFDENTSIDKTAVYFSTNLIAQIEER
jgi:hypothetical protein